MDLKGRAVGQSEKRGNEYHSFLSLSRMTINGYRAAGLKKEHIETIYEIERSILFT